MCSNRLERYYQILELDPGSSLFEITSSYLQLKELYSNESMATNPIDEEFTEDTRGEILKQIELAYTKLREAFECEGRKIEHENESLILYDNGFKSEVENMKPFSGQTLKHIREKLGVELSEISVSTKIRICQLEYIEEESFDSLPQGIFVKGFVSAYAKCLALDPEGVVNDYMKRYELWRRTIGRYS